MDNYTFLQTMGRGRHPEGAGITESSYCIFACPIQEPVVHQRIFGDEAALTLELNYGEGDILSDLRLRQAGTNLIVEESSVGLFGNFLTDREVKYIGQAFIYALMFKIDNLRELIELSIKDMKTLEDSLDNRIDNSGTYQILDFRRRYTEYGNQIISLKEIIARIDKGYYPMQMQNSYVLQGQLALDFKFLEERYELNKNTIIKDLDTYTSIVSNNLSRNTRRRCIKLYVRKPVSSQSGYRCYRRRAHRRPDCRSCCFIPFQRQPAFSPAPRQPDSSRCAGRETCR